MPNIINWGQGTYWDFQIPSNLQRIKDSPFNGNAFKMACGREPNGPNNSAGPAFWYHLWDSTARFSADEVEASSDQIAEACTGSFSENFLNGRLTLADDRDWWAPASSSAWDVVYEHAYQLGYITGKSGCRGIVFDLEEFPVHFPPSQYTNINSDADWHPKTDYVMGFGRTFVQNLQNGFRQGRIRRGGNLYDKFVIGLDRALFSDNTDLGPFANPNPHDQNHTINPAFVRSPAFLHDIFLNGMLVGADAQTHFIDACEPESYFIHGGHGRTSGPNTFDGIRWCPVTVERLHENPMKSQR